eukprot:1593233-Alexandrium_andersonii.AAC.1
MACEPPVIQPCATWAGCHWVTFEPTRPSAATQNILSALPSTFDAEQAAKLGCSVEESEVVPAIQLPDCTVCHEYATFQN